MLVLSCVLFPLVRNLKVKFSLLKILNVLVRLTLDYYL